MRAAYLLGLSALLLSAAPPASGQTFPDLSGRVVDAANLLSPSREAALTAKLEALEQASSRQLVVATIPDLQGYDIADYGYRLGRTWKIGQAESDNGTLLLVAPTDRKVRIEVGYGLEAILPDSVANGIVQDRILPAFRSGDYPGGIDAGVDAIAEQLRAPPEVAERKAVEAARAASAQRARGGGDSSIVPLIFFLMLFFFVVLPMLRRAGGGRRHRRRGWGGPVVIWGPGFGGGGGGFGGGFGGGGGGGGGFSGGGGSFGGGGASGSW